MKPNISPKLVIYHSTLVGESCRVQANIRCSNIQSLSRRNPSLCRTLRSRRVFFGTKSIHYHQYSGHRTHEMDLNYQDRSCTLHFSFHLQACKSQRSSCKLKLCYVTECKITRTLKQLSMTVSGLTGSKIFKVRGKAPYSTA